jgi:hypothetical protein
VSSSSGSPETANRGGGCLVSVTNWGLLAHPCSKDKNDSAAIATKPLIKTLWLSIFLHSWTNPKIMTFDWLEIISFRTKKSTKLTKESDYAIENATASAFPVACWSGAEIPSPGLRG